MYTCVTDTEINKGFNTVEGSRGTEWRSTVFDIEDTDQLLVESQTNENLLKTILLLSLLSIFKSVIFVKQPMRCMTILCM